MTREECSPMIKTLCQTPEGHICMDELYTFLDCSLVGISNKVCQQLHKIIKDSLKFVRNPAKMQSDEVYWMLNYFFWYYSSYRFYKTLNKNHFKLSIAEFEESPLLYNLVEGSTLEDKLYNLGLFLKKEKDIHILDFVKYINKVVNDLIVDQNSVKDSETNEVKTNSMTNLFKQEKENGFNFEYYSENLSNSKVFSGTKKAKNLSRNIINANRYEHQVKLEELKSEVEENQRTIETIKENSNYNLKQSQVYFKEAKVLKELNKNYSDSLLSQNAQIQKMEKEMNELQPLKQYKYKLNYEYLYSNKNRTDQIKSNVSPKNKLILTNNNVHNKFNIVCCNKNIGNKSYYSKSKILIISKSINHSRDTYKTLILTKSLQTVTLKTSANKPSLYVEQSHKSDNSESSFNVDKDKSGEQDYEDRKASSGSYSYYDMKDKKEYIESFITQSNNFLLELKGQKETLENKVFDFIKTKTEIINFHPENYIVGIMY